MQYYLFFLFVIVIAKSFGMDTTIESADVWVRIDHKIYAAHSANPLDTQLKETCNVYPRDILELATLEGSGFEQIIKEEKKSEFNKNIFINSINLADALPKKGYLDLTKENIKEKMSDPALFLDVYLIPLLLENDHFVQFAVTKKNNVISSYIKEYRVKNENLRFITSDGCKKNVLNILQRNSSSLNTENESKASLEKNELISSKDKQYNELTKAFEDKSKQIKDLESQIVSLQKQLDNSTIQSATQCESILAKEKQLSTFINTLEDKSKQIKDFEGQIISLQEQLKHNKVTNITVNDQQENLIINVNVLENEKIQLDNTKKERDNFETLYNNTTEEIKSLKIELEKESAIYHNARVELSNEKIMLTRNNAEDLVSLQLIILGKDKKISDLENTITELRQQNVPLNQETVKLKNSTLQPTDPKKQALFRLNDPFLVAFFVLLTLNIGYYSQETIVTYCQALLEKK